FSSVRSILSLSSRFSPTVSVRWAVGSLSGAIRRGWRRSPIALGSLVMVVPFLRKGAIYSGGCRLRGAAAGLLHRAHAGPHGDVNRQDLRFAPLMGPGWDSSTSSAIVSSLATAAARETGTPAVSA